MSLGLVQWLLVEPPAIEEERRELWRKGLKIDYVGFILVALWLGCLEIVLDEGQLKDWFASNFIIAFTVVSAVSLIILIPWELRRDDPVLDVRLVFGRQFGTSFVIMMAVGAVLFASTQILPQLLQQAFGYSAYLSGLSMMPGGIAMLVMMPLAGQITNHIQPKYLIALGLAAISVAMWHMTSLVPDANFHFFEFARVFQMVGLPFLFIPINTVAYSGLRPDQTNNASALINMARNLGGSFGISLANTVVARRSQFHHERLAEAITPGSPNYENALQQAQHYFEAQGASVAHAKQLAFGWIAQTVGQQSVLLAYIDVFWVSSMFALCMVPLVLLLLKRVDMKASRAPVH
jgi:DHA2 family multidrug resistance protein